MEKKFIYRFLNYLTIDYKALEMYLEEMGQKGYELEKISTLGIGKFRVIKPHVIHYYVDLIDHTQTKAYENLDEASGWQEIKMGNAIRIYKEKENNIEAMPIPIDEEIKKKQVLKTILKKEGWMILFSILWLMMGLIQLSTIDYYDLLDNRALQFAFMNLLIGGIYSLYSICLIVFIVKSLKGEGYQPTLRGAKYRRNVYYGAILLFSYVCINLICSNKMQLILSIPLVIMMGIIIMMTIFYKKYADKPYKTKEKQAYINILYSVGIIVIILGTAMLSITLVSRIPHGRPLLEDERVEAKAVGVLSLRDFPGYETNQIEWIKIDSGESFALNKYYDYQEEYKQMRFDVEYYDCKNEKAAQIIWDKLYSRHSDESIAYGVLEKIDGSCFGADKAYKHQNRNKLLLRKDNMIIFIASEALNFYDKANADIIKAAFNEKGKI